MVGSGIYGWAAGLRLPIFFAGLPYSENAADDRGESAAADGSRRAENAR